MRTMNSRRQKSKGQTLVESCFVLLTLLLMLIAILDFGQLLFFQNMVTERAREGARWATVNTYNVDDIKNYIAFGTTSPPAGATQGFFGLKPAMVTVTQLPSAADFQYVGIRISYPMYFFTPLLSRSWTTNVNVVKPVESLGATT